MSYSTLLKNTAMCFILFLGIIVTAPLTVQPIPAFDYRPIDVKQLSCLAANIFYEASGESVLGQAAVARVVLNRVAYGFANTPCGVIYQTTTILKADTETGEEIPVKVCQFSWVCAEKSPPSRNNPGYKQAEQIALEVLSRDAYRDVVPKNTLFFHNALVDPLWPYKQVAAIGNHIFYSKDKRVK